MVTPMDNLSTVVGQLLTWVGQVLSTITSNALLLIPFAIFVVGAVIGLVKRLMGR